MPHRVNFLQLLTTYTPSDPREQEARRRMIRFVENNDDCLFRSNLSGHLTGSCWLVSPSQTQVLLTHHKKIGAWLQLGGHADGNGDLLAVALQEATEESGINGILPVEVSIFDLDIHHIKEHKGVPPHLHYDVRFALIAPTLNFSVSDESHDLAWANIAWLAEDREKGESIRRMARKWLQKHPR